MKKIGKLAAMAASAALALTMGAFSLTGCAGGTDYTFEAEEAVLTGETQTWTGTTPATVSAESAYKINGELVEDATIVGVENFSGVGQKITWTVVSSAECKATLTLHAASAAMAMSEAGFSLAELNMAEVGAYKLSCNGTEAAMSGTLPGNAELNMEEAGVWWNMGTATAQISLKAGENVIELEIVGGVDGAMSAGLNVDKIVIKATSELSAKA